MADRFGWIAVGERMPAGNEEVLVYDADYGRVGVGHRRSYAPHRLVLAASDDCNITHWQPLPPLPESEVRD